MKRIILWGRPHKKIAICIRNAKEVFKATKLVLKQNASLTLDSGLVVFNPTPYTVALDIQSIKFEEVLGQ